MNSYLFLDIDGVLNPYVHTSPGEGWTTRTVAGYKLWINADITDRLAAIDGAQIVWATTWVRDPRALHSAAKAYGLPTNLPRIDKTKVTWQGWEDPECGKRPGLIDYINRKGINPEATPVVWVDDMLGRGDLLWAQARGVHAIKTDERVGLGDPGVLDKVCSLLTVEAVVA